MNEEFNKPILAEGVKIEKSIFDMDIAGETKGKGLTLGGMLGFDIAQGNDLIILMGNRGGGYEPYRCLLPHQVYLDDIKKAFAEKSYEVIYVVPIKASAPFPLVYKGEYGRQRWEPKKQLS